MNKRGAETFMAEKTANIILAVISIVVLLLLGYSLFGMIFQQQEYQQAKATIDGIQETINYLNEGKSATYLIESPKNWGLITSENNLCLCKYQDFDRDVFFQNDDSLIKTCKISGVCVVTEYPFETLVSYAVNKDNFFPAYSCFTPSKKIDLGIGEMPLSLHEYRINNCYRIYRVPALVNLTLRPDKIIYVNISS